MNPEQKVVSLELAKALKDAGAKGMDTEYFWAHVRLEDEGKNTRIMLVREWDIGDIALTFCDPIAAAPDCAELLEMLPKEIEPARFLRIQWCDDGWLVGYPGIKGKSDKCLVEALGKLLLWCIKKGYVRTLRMKGEI